MKDKGAGERKELDLLQRTCPSGQPPPPSLIQRKRGQGVMLYVGRELRNEDVRQLTPPERWARIALKLLVADCPYRPVLCISPGNPFTDAQIAKHLLVSLPVWKRVKKKLLERGEIEISPKVGIKYALWAGDYGKPWGPRLIPADPSAFLQLSEEELRRHEDLRTWLIVRFNIITGSEHTPDDRIFIDNVEKRIAEGATKEDLDIAMRTYLWVCLNSTPKVSRTVVPFKAFRATTFWKWRKMNFPAPMFRLTSTFEFIQALPEPTKTRVKQYCRDYMNEIRMTLRRNGWDNLYDVDFTKIETCQQYVHKRMEA